MEAGESSNGFAEELGERFADVGESSRSSVEARESCSRFADIGET